MAATTTAKKTAQKAPTTEVAKAATPKVAKPAAKAVTALQNDDEKVAGIRLHGKEFVGTVISDKAHKTVTVEWERRRLVPKFERYEKRYSRVYAHNPTAMNARMGDTVRVKETRPLSKTKHFMVVEVVKRAEDAQ